MTSEQEAKCHAIIHSHALACGAGNAVPVAGLGIAVDVVTMTTMACALAAVFGTDNLPAEVAKGIAVAATISAGFLEAAGWIMAKDLESRAK